MNKLKNYLYFVKYGYKKYFIHCYDVFQL